MRSRSLFVASLLACALLGGCALPEPDYIGGSRFTIDDLNKHIRCELERSGSLSVLSTKGYVVQVTLSLKVDSNGGVTPNVSFLSPATFGYAINANLNLDRQQTYSTSYVLNLKALADDKGKPPERCGNSDLDVAHSLSGNLEIDQIVKAGMDEIADSDFNVAAKPVGGFVGSATDTTKYPNFGSTVQFMLTKSIDTGPSWTLTDFKGPSGAAKGILNGGETTTDYVIFAFAAGPVPDPDKIARLQKALDDAKKNYDDARKALEDAQAAAGKPLPRGLSASLLETRKGTLEALVESKQLTVDRAQRELMQKQSDLNQAETPSPSDAAAAAQSFTTPIILQNLSGQLH